MMGKIESSSYFNGQKVRIIKQGKLGQPWWIAKDVCDVLGFSDASQATRYLDNDEKTTLLIKQDGSNYKSNQVIINEPGLYSLILRSRKPEAKAFKRWITHDVLPMIRQTGMYIPPGIKRMGLLHDKYEDELIRLFSLSRWPLQREVSDVSPYPEKDSVRYDLVRQNTKKYDVFELSSTCITLEKCIETAISRGYHQSIYKRKGKRDARLIFLAPEISSYALPFVGKLEDDPHIGYRAVTYREYFDGIAKDITEKCTIGKWNMEKQLERENFPYLNGAFNKTLYLTAG